MDTVKIKSILDSASNGAVLLVMLSILSLLSFGYFAKRNTPIISSGLKKGQLLNISDVDLKRSPQTLLIMLDTNCSNCIESLSFYQNLQHRNNVDKLVTQILIVFPNSKTEADDYLLKHKLLINSINSINLQSLRITQTPTLILVDNNGQITNFWVGKLSENEERQVLQAVSLTDN